MAQLSVEIDGPYREGEGKARRHLSRGKGDFLRTFKEGVETLHDAFENACREYSELDFLGLRIKDERGVAGPYQFMKYKDVYERVCNIAAGLAALGVQDKDNIGLYSINRPEWVMAEYACYRLNLVTVPLYDTLGDEAIEHICNQTEMKLIVASKEKVKSHDI